MPDPDPRAFRKYGYQPTASGPPPTTPPAKPPAPNREVLDPEQPGAAFWPATVEDHRALLAALEAELASALRTIAALHRCPHCDRPLVGPYPARPIE